MAREKVLSAAALIKNLENTKAKYQRQYNRQIPYFRRIIEELKAISKIEDTIDSIKNLKFLETNCGKSKKRYSDKEIMPILSLFTATINFLEYQQKSGILIADFNKIYEYNLSNILTTSEDKLFLYSETNETIIISAKRQSLRAKSLNVLSKYDSPIGNKDIFTILQQKIKELKVIKVDKNEISGQINNFNLNFKKEKQAARKWWHWPLKFLTCGMWESNNIKTINKKYSKDSFDKLVDEFNMLDSKVNNLEGVIETLKSKIEKLEKKTKGLEVSYLNYGKEWKSLNDLSEHDTAGKNLLTQSLL